MSLMFEPFNYLKQQYPDLQSNVLKFLNHSQVLEEPFHFPSSPHPLAKFAKIIQRVRENPNDLENLVHSFRSLDDGSKILFDRKIEIFLRNSAELRQLYFGSNEGAFHRLDQQVKNTLAQHIYDLSTDSNKCNWGWGGGERHALDNADCLKRAVDRLVDQDILGACEEKIRNFAVNFYQNLPPSEKASLHGSIYQIAGRPRTSDYDWGRTHALSNSARLISALHCHGKIPGPVIQASFLKSWENDKTPVPSQYYSIEGNELPRGEINYINGMLSSYEQALQNAHRLREAYFPGAAMHCIYAATQGAWDLASAALTQANRILPQGRLLLQRWSEFFERAEENENYLQICHSRGAIDVASALNVLPLHLRHRINVIAIAPAYIIDRDLCPNAVNLVIPEDSVPKLAPNKHLIGTDPSVKILPNHADRSDPHDLHGSSYKEAIAPFVRQYLVTNRIQ